MHTHLIAAALLLCHLHSGNWTDLQAMLQESWFLEEKHTDLRDYVGAMRNVYGNTEQLSTTDLQAFEVLANAGNAGAGLCWSVLLQRDHWRYLPEVPMLSGWKLYVEAPHNQRPAVAMLPVLQVQPNPATDRLWITYDMGSDADRIVVYGPRAEQVYATPLEGRNGVLELETHSWISGIYLVRSLRDGLPIGEAKITILNTER